MLISYLRNCHNSNIGQIAGFAQDYFTNTIRARDNGDSLMTPIFQIPLQLYNIHIKVFNNTSFLCENTRILRIGVFIVLHEEANIVAQNHNILTGT